MPEKKADCKHPCGPEHKCETCCCKQVGFDYCVDKHSCGEGDYTDNTCAEVFIEVQWNAVPQCILDRVGAGTVKYKVYHGDVTDDQIKTEDPYLEIENPTETVCDGTAEIPRDKWATFVGFCANCSPKKFVLVITDGDDKVLEKCYACQDSLCDERCAGPCSFTSHCWMYGCFGEKCGWGFSDQIPLKRYATAIVTQWGEMHRVFDPPPEEEECDPPNCCQEIISKIGFDEGNPVTFTSLDVGRLHVVCGTGMQFCSPTCSTLNGHGETNVSAPFGTGATGSGGLDAGVCGVPIQSSDPGANYPFPCMGEFVDPPSTEDEEEVRFYVCCYDDESAITEWELIADAPPTYREWSWNSSEHYLDGAHHCNSNITNETIGYTTTANNSLSMSYDDEILTSELIAGVTAVLATDTNFTSEFESEGQSNPPCYGCFLLSANQLQCYYTSAYIRITNTSETSVIFSWDVVYYHEGGNPESPCQAGDEFDRDHQSSGSIEPGDYTDVYLYPDTFGANVVLHLEHITCVPAPV